MIVLLIVQLTSIESQRQIARDQNRKVTTLLRQALPLIRETRPLVATVAASVEPLKEGLRAADPVGTLSSVKRLTDSLAGQDRLLALIDAGVATLTELSDRHILARADGALRATPVALDRLRRTVVLQRDLLRMQRQTFALTSQSVAVQRRSFQLLSQSLAVQRESLRHIESLDRKTGGTVPPDGG
jgi:hypothetical protein